MKMKKECSYKSRHNDFHDGDGKCFICKEKVAPTYYEKLQAKVDAVPKEDKQKLLDAMWEGKTLGEAMELIGVDTEVGGKIFVDCIGTHRYLKREV